MLFLSQKRTAKDCRYAKQKELKAKEKTEKELKQNPETSESLISEGFDFDKQNENIWICDSGATNGFLYILQEFSYTTDSKSWK